MNCGDCYGRMLRRDGCHNERCAYMIYDLDPSVYRKAKSAHELFMLNLAAFHLLLAPAAIVLDIVFGIGIESFLLPLTASLSVIAFTYLRARHLAHTGPWFVAAHWKLAVRRSLILLGAYAIGGTIVGIGLLAAAGTPDHNMQSILITVFARIAAAPLLLGVIVCFVLESGAIYQAGRGEVPDSLVKRFPPPAATEPA